MNRTAFYIKKCISVKSLTIFLMLISIVYSQENEAEDTLHSSDTSNTGNTEKEGVGLQDRTYNASSGDNGNNDPIVPSGHIFDAFLNIGAAFPLGGRYIESSTDTSDEGNITDQEDHYLNLGNGIQINGGINYTLMEKLALRIGVSFTGGVPRIKDKDVNDENDYENTDKYSFRQFGFNFSLIPRFRVLDLLDMYTGLGTGLYFASADIDGDANPYNGYMDFRPALSLSGLIGADYPISGTINLFAEVGFRYMSFELQESRATHDPTPVEYNKDAVNSPPPEKYPGSNFGIRIGVKYIFF